jgi:hypothetical protein
MNGIGVRDQRHWDRFSELRKGGFLAHRSPTRSADETEIRYGQFAVRAAGEDHPPGEEGLFKQLKKALSSGRWARSWHTILVMRRAIPLAKGPATASEFMPQRMSVWPAAIHTRTPDDTGIIAAPEDPEPAPRPPPASTMIRRSRDTTISIRPELMDRVGHF